MCWRALTKQNTAVILVDEVRILFTIVMVMLMEAVVHIRSRSSFPESVVEDAECSEERPHRSFHHTCKCICFEFGTQADGWIVPRRGGPTR